MSLVNDMLKNLERRNAEKQADYSIHNPETEEESLFLKAFVVALIISLFIGLCFAFAYYFKYRPHFYVSHSKTIKINQTQAVSASDQIFANTIHINDLVNQTEITIDFNAPTTFVTNLDPVHNIESITLEKTKLNVAALCKQLNKSENCLVNNEIPLLVNPSTIKSIHVDQNDGSYLTLSFQLISPAALKESRFTGNHLQLIFSKTPCDTDTANNSINEASPTNSIAPPPPPKEFTNGPSDAPTPMIQTATEPTLSPRAMRFDRIYNLIMLKQYDKAQQQIDQLSNAEQQSGAGLMVRAKLQMALGDNARALKILKTYPFDEHTPSLDFYAMYAAALTFDGQYAEATTVYKKLVQSTPDNTTWLLGLGITATKANQPALAKDAFQRILTIGDPNPEISDYVRKQIEQLNLIG